MKKFFYPRLALSNIRKNAKVYLPYLLTSTFTVMMCYVIHSLAVNQSLRETSSTAPAVLMLGTWVVIIFSVIFLFYVNSFLIKRRKKEIALYNILGMEKKHVMIMMAYETIFTTLISLILGILFGALFSKLMFLLLVNLSQIQTAIIFEIPQSTIFLTLTVYGIIFFTAYLFNVIQIKLANPIELLRGGEHGEREPKTKWLFTLVGILTLGGGYYLAQTIEDPMDALTLFFVAVVLVIIGTYCLFTAGSIVILKMLKKNKRFYYQTRHFTSVSQMIYRMKQNAVGLASICVLCTCILVMISSTVTLYLGVKDTVQIMQEEDFLAKIFTLSEGQLPSRKELDELHAKIEDGLKAKDIETSTIVMRSVYEVAYNVKDNEYVTGEGSNGRDFKSFSAMTLEEYNRAYHKNETLKDNEVLVHSNFEKLASQMKINGKTVQVKSEVHDQYFLETELSENSQLTGIVFKDEKTLKDVLFTLEDQVRPNVYISIDYQDKSDMKEADNIVPNIINDLQNTGEYSVYTSSQYSMEKMFNDSYGSLFFLGLFLGLLFLMAAILIMYYKQLSEGYEDQKRFEIMQNVGMSKKEVKQTIRSQVLIFFFLPLVVAVIHMAFAFKMIMKMFGYLIASGEGLFITCTIISVIILAIIYSIVYFLTAKTYYKIVRH
ncbi:ABC transporter permease [Candidatus Stoquefichus sp. SB1]|uniref:ABC transporter permease n=1 Tax=Candidatus Stoquefichus sp. SB1 TaxID=1658109 RepID=UPI00067F4B88|nr:ABC transporter permease [Candidatus Stoquefichus sp. SB1]